MLDAEFLQFGFVASQDAYDIRAVHRASVVAYAALAEVLAALAAFGRLLARLVGADFGKPLLHLAVEDVLRRALVFERNFRRHLAFGLDAAPGDRQRLQAGAASSPRRRSPRSRNAPCSSRTSRSGRCRKSPSRWSPSIRQKSWRSLRRAGSTASASRKCCASACPTACSGIPGCRRGSRGTCRNG